MNLSVVVPSKTASNLTPCVGAVRKCEPEARIIVVDDSDSQPSEIAQFCAQNNVDWERGPKPFVFAKAVNQGIRSAMDPVHTDNGHLLYEVSDAVVLLNDDALLQTPGGFAKLAQFAEAHPEVGCVAPATNITGQPLQWPRHRTPEGWRYVDTVPYVCVYLPRRTLDAVGLLDERYCLDYGCEDRDHTEAMQRAGLKVAVLYDVYVDHGSLRSSFRGDPKAPKSFARNYALYKQKWGIR